MPEDSTNLTEPGIFTRGQIDETLLALTPDQSTRWSAMSERLREDSTPREWNATFAEFLRREALRRGATLAIVAISPVTAAGALVLAALVGLAAGYALGRRRAQAAPSGWA